MKLNIGFDVFLEAIFEIVVFFCLLLACFFVYSSTLKMEATRSFETPKNIPDYTA
jgi:hypothetical protein